VNASKLHRIAHSVQEVVAEMRHQDTYCHGSALVLEQILIAAGADDHQIEQVLSYVRSLQPVDVSGLALVPDEQDFDGTTL